MGVTIGFKSYMGLWERTRVLENKVRNNPWLVKNACCFTLTFYLIPGKKLMRYNVIICQPLYSYKC